MNFEGGAIFDVQTPGAVGAHWHQLADDFFQQVDQFALVQLVVTDRFETVVDEWQRQSPSEYGDQGAATYVADKIDGTRAAAKTVVLDGRRSVVVAAIGTLGLGTDVARWMLTHEAQHVKLHARDTAAWAVQRRSGREIRSSRPWEFVWSAEGAIDEFRCERATHSKLPPLQPTYDPADFHAVMRRLDEARSAWTFRGDLHEAHSIVAQVIDRLSVIAAYSAAAIESGHDTRARWSSASELEPIWACLRQTPGVDETTSHSQLWELASNTAEKIDQALRRARVELSFVDDCLSLYFR